MNGLPICDFRENEMHVYFHEDVGETELCFFHNKSTHKMRRTLSESMQKTCSRLSKKFSKSNSLRVTVSLNQEVVDITTRSNADWTSGMVIAIDGFEPLTVVVNCPVVLSIHCFPTRHMRVGSPVVPRVETQFSTDVLFSWYCKHPDQDSYICASTDSIFWPSPEWIDCAVKVFATPLSDNGCVQQGGRTVTLYLPHPITPEGPTPRMLDVRQDYLDTPPLGSLRMMTYNILASAYATSAHALQEMYNYVPDPDLHLAEEYRAQLVVKELLASRADVICLQECDQRLFVSYLLDIMKQAGYDGHFTLKDGHANDGCASFLRRSSLHPIAYLDISYQDIIGADARLGALFTLKPDVRDYLVDKIGSIAQVCIAQSVQNPAEVLLVGNTHLFYHPRGCHVRILQGNALLQVLENVRQSIVQKMSSLESTAASTGCGVNRVLSDWVGVEWGERCGVRVHDVSNRHDAFPSTATTVTDSGTSVNGSTPEYSGSEVNGLRQEAGAGGVSVSVAILGDMNSGPQSGWVEYLQRGTLPPCHEAWKLLYRFSWEGSEHDSLGGKRKDLTEEQSAEFYDQIVPLLPEMKHNMKLISAAGYPPFTNYTRDFKMTLDYIFVESDKMEVVAIAPLPSENILSENIALPSIVFPSDHISLVVDVLLANSIPAGESKS